MSSCNICGKKPGIIANDGGSFSCCGRSWHYCRDFGKVREGRAHLGRPHPEKTYPPVYHECPKCGEGHQSYKFRCCDRDWHFSRSENKLVRD